MGPTQSDAVTPSQDEHELEQMAETRFEATVRILAGATGRRAALRALAVSAFGGALASLVGEGGADEAAARKKRRANNQKQRRRQRRARAQKKADNCAKAGQKPKAHKPCCAGLLEDSSGRCALPSEPCDVCASGCTYPTVQAAAADLDGPTTITICAGTYVELVTIDRDLTLIGAGDGDGADATILQGVGVGSVMTVAAGRMVAVQGVRITNGVAELGGGVRNSGDLTLSSSTVTGNTGDFGGGIYNDQGTLTASGSTLSFNVGNDSGGGLYNLRGTVELTSCTVSDNEGGFGGGIDSEGPNATLTLLETTVHQNTANGLGGGLFLDGASMVSLTGSTVSDNTASAEGGGIAIDDEPSVLSVTLLDSTVSGNTGLSGGGIFSVGGLTLTGSTVSGNSAVDPGPGDLHGDGGGIYNAALGMLTLDTSSVTGNNATHEGGGMLNAGAVACSDAGTVTGNLAGTAGAENCFDAGGNGCLTCNTL